jgi:hypothetical protein
MRQITHLIEPGRLLLCWKSLQNSHTNYVVAEVLPGKNDFVLRYFFNSCDFAKAQQEGFIGLPAFPIDKKSPQAEFSQGVRDALMRRTPPRTRTDFPQYLEQHGLSLHKNLSDFALLGYSEARLPGDGFFLVHPFDDHCGPLELVTEVVGIKYGQFKQAHVNVDDTMTLAPEPNNQSDLDAIAVFFGSFKIGFINRCQTAAFHRWIKMGCLIKMTVRRLNGTEERPRVVAFIEVTPLPSA